MSDTCLKCRTEDVLLASEKGWHDLAEYGIPGLRVDGMDINKVELYKASDSMDRSYYGEYPQGWEGDMWVTFRVGNRFFRKMGTISSYGHEKWDGPFREVFATEKVVTVFEFKEDK